MRAVQRADLQKAVDASTEARAVFHAARPHHWRGHFASPPQRATRVLPSAPRDRRTILVAAARRPALRADRTILDLLRPNPDRHHGGRRSRVLGLCRLALRHWL